MSIFDKFFTKFAYKFDKGYPDMNNDQDVLLLESLISEVVGYKFSLTSEGKADRDIRDLLIKKNPNAQFITQSKDKRIASKAKITDQEFVEIIKNTFGWQTVELEKTVTPARLSCSRAAQGLLN